MNNVYSRKRDPYSKSSKNSESDLTFKIQIFIFLPVEFLTAKIQKLSEIVQKEDLM